MAFDYDVLIVGGGPAGLSAALSLSRLRRHVVLCDDQRPRNKPSAHLNNFPTRDGIHPAQWRELAKADVLKYGTTDFIAGTVTNVTQLPVGFAVERAGHAAIRVRKLILADGITDRLPAIPGVQELWGQAIYHCPFCHGYEVAGRKLALFAQGEFAEHMLPMIWGLSKDLVLLTHGPAQLSAEFLKVLAAKNIPVLQSPLVKIEHTELKMRRLVFADGTELDREGMFMAPQLPFQVKSSIAEQLGCEKTEVGADQGERARANLGSWSLCGGR